MIRLAYRQQWVQPVPMEAEWLRLPWWLNLPRKLLLIVSPILMLVAVVVLAVFIARKLYRYPLGLVLLIAALVLYAWAGCPVVAVLGGVVLLVGVGCWRWPGPWVSRAVARQARSEWRRATCYVPGWRKTTEFSELTKSHRWDVHYPKLTRVRSDGWRDRVTVRMLRGQCPEDYARAADRLAHSFGARACRVRVTRPRRLAVDFLHTDPLADPIALPALPAIGAVDLRRLVVGRLETGRDWRLRLLHRHVLVAGVTDAGKSSLAWSLLWALAPAIRTGAVQVFGIDPKGGMELGKAPGLFHELTYGNGEASVELLERVALRTRQQAEALREQGRRVWEPASGAPFVLLIVDELADVIAYQPDPALRKRATLALSSITSQGRAPGAAVLGQVQDPRKSVVDFRNLFPVKIAMRLDEREQVDMVLGDGARERGAAAHEIAEDTPGVAWVKIDGRREPDRGRAFHVTDTDLDELGEYVTGGHVEAPRPLVLTGIRGA
ncbi:MAG: FtsK/SpoIIIE domain-containing protein [Actinomycetota bacterium]|nr:FtsK/SpoIIIE domain-containing protein [Actinomycetota bacterium]